MKLLGIVALSVLSLASFAPVASMMVSVLAAAVLRCNIDDTLRPCVAFGTDLSQLLYAGILAGWAVLFTWPGMLASCLGWVLVAILAARRRAGMRAGIAGAAGSPTRPVAPR